MKDERLHPGVIPILAAIIIVVAVLLVGASSSPEPPVVASSSNPACATVDVEAPGTMTVTFGVSTAVAERTTVNGSINLGSLPVDAIDGVVARTDGEPLDAEAVGLGESTVYLAAPKEGVVRIYLVEGGHREGAIWYGGDVVCSTRVRLSRGTPGGGRS